MPTFQSLFFTYVSDKVDINPVHQPALEQLITNLQQCSFKEAHWWSYREGKPIYVLDLAGEKKTFSLTIWLDEKVNISSDGISKSDSKEISVNDGTDAFYLIRHIINSLDLSYCLSSTQKD